MFTSVAAKESGPDKRIGSFLYEGREMNQGVRFEGFEKPKSNYSKLPHDIINTLPQIETLAEMKVILYILRHTWGFQEYGPEENKKITLDEFQHGRKRRDQTRMDNGTGLAKSSIIDGLKRAQEHGFILVETDDRDAARVRKYYCLNMLDQGYESHTSGVQTSYPRGTETIPRTEKETSERNSGNSSLSKKAKAAKTQPPPADPQFEISLYLKDKDHVRAIGNWTNGPWEVKCFHCGEGVRIGELDTAVECLCGMHEYTLVKKKKHVAGKREIGPVEAYLTIAGRKKHTIAQEWLDEIEKTVTDLPFWRQVVKEYCGRGWNRGNIAKMLEYYKEGRLPGTRKKKEPEGPEVTEIGGVRTLVYKEEKKGPKAKEVDGRRVRVYD